jgi:hypothetical protein
MTTLTSMALPWYSCHCNCLLILCLIERARKVLHGGCCEFMLLAKGGTCMYLVVARVCSSFIHLCVWRESAKQEVPPKAKQSSIKEVENFTSDRSEGEGITFARVIFLFPN